LGSFFECVKTVLDEISLVIVPYLRCSSDLGPSDFWLFGHIKSFHAGRMCNHANDLFEAIIEFLNEIQPSELQLVFHHWIERVKWILANNRDYRLEETTDCEFER
jgi:hypothetical protein